MPGPPTRILRTIPLLVILIAGCGNDQQELADLAREHLQQQAAQNKALLERTQQLTGAAQDLVEADAQARRELIRTQERLQTQLSSERQNLDRQRDDLESERRELAQQRHREPIIAAAILQGALVLLAIVPLVICSQLFRTLRDEPPDAAVGELLIQEFVAEQPLLLPAPSALLVLVNFHRFLQSAELVQAVSRQIVQGKLNRCFVVVLSPVVQIPTELEKHFVVLEHDLPDRQQLEELARGIATEPGELPDEADLEQVLDAAAGLTRYEAEGAFSLSLVRHGRITPEALWELKSQTLRKSGLLSLHRGTESFGSLGGPEALKSFCRSSIPMAGDRTGP